MKRVWLACVLVVWGSACGRDSSSPDSGDNTPAVVKGSVTVHTRLWESKLGEKATSAHVLLGNGSRFLQQMGTSSDVTFKDASLEGPQDITLVVQFSSGFTHAYTYLGVNTPEVWLPNKPKDPPASPTQLAYISGKVSGLVNSSNTYVRVAGTGIKGSGSVAADGSYRIQVEGTLPGVVDLVAYETGSDFGDVKSVGLRRSVSVPDGQQVSGQDLALDHPLDLQAKLTINNAQAYKQTFGWATLSFYQDDRKLFEVSKDAFETSSLPTSLPAFALTAPFDSVRAVLKVEAGLPSDNPGGWVRAQGPVENLSSVTFSLPKPMTLTTPTLGTVFDPGPASLQDPTFRWSADAEARTVELSLSPQPDPFDPNAPPSGNFAWTVMAPGSVSSFTPFMLPSAVWSRAPISAGQYDVSLYSRFEGAADRYEDLFAQTPPRDPLARAWSTQVYGTVEFK